MSMSHLRISSLNLLNNILAFFDSPVKSEAIKLTENVVLIIVANHVQVLIVVDRELLVVRLDLKSLYLTNFHLTS